MRADEGMLEGLFGMLLCVNMFLCGCAVWWEVCQVVRLHIMDHLWRLVHQSVKYQIVMGTCCGLRALYPWANGSAGLSESIT